MCAVMTALSDEQARQSVLRAGSSDASQYDSGTQEHLSYPTQQRHAFSLHEDEIDTSSVGSSDVSVTAYSEGEYGILRVRRHARRNMPPLPNQRSHRDTIPDVPVSCDSQFEEMVDDDDDGCQNFDRQSLRAQSSLRRISSHLSHLRTSQTLNRRMPLSRPDLSPKGPRPLTIRRPHSDPEPSREDANADAKLLHRLSESAADHRNTFISATQSCEDVRCTETMIDAVLDDVEKDRHAASIAKAGDNSVNSVESSSSVEDTSQSAYVTDVDSEEAQQFLQDSNFNHRHEHYFRQQREAQEQARESGILDPVLGSSSSSETDEKTQAVREPSFLRVPSDLFPHTPCQRRQPQATQAASHGRRERSGTITPLQMGVRRSARGTFWNPLSRTGQVGGVQHEAYFEKQSAAEDLEAQRRADAAANRKSYHYTRDGVRATIYPRRPDEFALRPRQHLSRETLFADYNAAKDQAKKQGRRRSQSLSSYSPQHIGQASSRGETRPEELTKTRGRAATTSSSKRPSRLCSWCSDCGGMPPPEAGSQSRRSCCSEIESGDESSSSCSCCECSWCQGRESVQKVERSEGKGVRCSSCNVELCDACLDRPATTNTLAVPQLRRTEVPTKKAATQRPSIVTAEGPLHALCESPTKMSNATRDADNDLEGQDVYIYPGAPILSPLPVLSPFYINPYKYWPGEGGSVQIQSQAQLDTSGDATGSSDQAHLAGSVIAQATITNQVSATARLCAPGEVLRRRRPISRRLSKQRHAAELLLEMQEAADRTSRCETCCEELSPQCLDVDSDSASSPGSGKGSESDAESSASLTTSSSSPLSSTASEAHTPPRSQYAFSGCESPGTRLSTIVSPLVLGQETKDSKSSTESNSAGQLFNLRVPPYEMPRRLPRRDSVSRSTSSSSASARAPLRSILKSSDRSSSRASAATSSSFGVAITSSKTPSGSISCYSTTPSSTAMTVTTAATKATSTSGERRTTVKLVAPGESHSPRDLPHKRPSEQSTRPQKTTMDLETRLQRETYRKKRNDERLGTLDKLEGRSKKSSLLAQLQELRADAAMHSSRLRGDSIATASAGSSAMTANGTTSSSEDDDEDVAFPASPLTPTRAVLRALEHAYEVKQQHEQFQDDSALRLAAITGFDVGVVPSKALKRNRSRSEVPKPSAGVRRLVKRAQHSDASATSQSSSDEKALHTQLRKFSLAIEARQVAKARCVDK